MVNKNTINYQEAKLSANINTLGFFLLATICAGYFLFIRRFAEIHLNLPFLGFPIFVGEIILFICLLLLGVKWLVRYKDANEDICTASLKVCLLFCGYAIFILGKALYGYSRWGALAFRDAALFYYPIYAIFGYVFYKQNFFEGLRTVLFVLLLSALLITKFDFYSYLALTGFLLSIILIKKYPNKYIKYTLFIILFIAMDYNGLISTSRTMLVGNIVAIVFIASALFSILKIRNRYKFIALGALFFLLMLWLLVRADRSAIDSLSKMGPLIKLYREQKDIIVKTEPTFKMKEIKKVMLYNPEVVENEKVLVPMEKYNINLKEAGKEVIAAVGALNKPQTIKDEGREKDEGRDIRIQYNNILFRILIWEDMIREFWRAKPILGFDLGKPLRSKSIEIIDIARSEWERDGWITPHNSYLHIIYRAGIVGIAYIVFTITLLFFMINKSLNLKSITGILLCGILINWLVAANFLVILELPYNAIPFWSLFGLTYAYLFKAKAHCG